MLQAKNCWNSKSVLDIKNKRASLLKQLITMLNNNLWNKTQQTWHAKLETDIMEVNQPS